MDASKVFMNVIKSVENSTLNYSISRTAYSATISIKSSFLKRYPRDSQVSDLEEPMNMSRDLQSDISRVKVLETENQTLKGEIEQLQLMYEKDQKVRLEELLEVQKVYDVEKEASAILESKLAESRQESLKIKKERKDADSNLIDAKEKSDYFEAEFKNLLKDKEVLQRELDKSVRDLKLKSDEVIQTNLEHEETKIQLNKLETKQEELEVFEVKQNTMNCDECDASINNLSELRAHMKRFHCQNKATQQDEQCIFEVYTCFYCDFPINSEENLETHSSICENNCVDVFELLTTVQELKSYTCEVCGAKCCDTEDLERHSEIYHWLKRQEIEVLESCQFQCEICPLNYKLKRDLDFHVRGCHWDQM